jgi:hypothetical protein
VQQLGESGVAASGDTGESDPKMAIQDALSTFPAERVLLFIHGDSDQQYREDLDVEELTARLGVPVEQVQLGGSSG